jgi:predicted ATP-dependent endonuclease of OLD family
MPTIRKLVLHNFKRFEKFELDFDSQCNVLVGDNESGKSSILLALDLALGASRSRVESIGLETLLNRKIAKDFLAGDKKYAQLPTLLIEVYLSEGKNPDINGKNNSSGIECDGVKMVCSPSDEFGKHIAEVLADDTPNFPFEYYEIAFTTFSGAGYSGFKKQVRHLLIDSSRIDTDYATREYTRSVYEVNTEPGTRNKLENLYRRSKSTFGAEHLAELNRNIDGGQFSLRTNTRSNLENDLAITEDDIAIEAKGKGRQCFIKTEFALSKPVTQKGIDVLLLEEPENHLSHGNMKRLVDRIAASKHSQLIIATHSSLISSRLGLRKAILLSAGQSTAHASLRHLADDTARFFMKAPDNNILEFVLSQRVILVEGDAEYILLAALYEKHAGGSTTEQDRVHVISVGGTSFKRYLDLAKLLSIKTAVIRDNDGDYQKNCVENYAEYADAHIRVFADQNSARSTFEICLYRDNGAACENAFSQGRRSLSVQDYMLSNKADAAFRLLEENAVDLVAPPYIQEAIEWIRA